MGVRHIERGGGGARAGDACPRDNSRGELNDHLSKQLGENVVLAGEWVGQRGWHGAWARVQGRRPQARPAPAEVISAARPEVCGPAGLVRDSSESFVHVMIIIINT